MLRRLVAATLALALIAGTAVIAGGTVAPAVATAEGTLAVHPGVQQVTITGGLPEHAYRLERGDGTWVYTAYSDEAGQLTYSLVPDQHMVFDRRDGGVVPSTRGAALQPGTYNIVEIPVGEDPPGTPEEETTPPTVETGEFTVMGVDDIPPRSFYEDQVLEEGFGYITTRDGTELSITVRHPDPFVREIWGLPADGPFPTVVEYSGYSPSNPEGTGEPGSMIANLMGFTSVGVNIRGTGCSGGVYDVFNAAQRADGYDVIETIAAQDWVLDNEVGMVGLSYSGILQLYAASTAPPSLAAITPLSVIEDPWDQQWPGGLYNEGFTGEWLAQRDSSSSVPSGWVKKVIEGTANPSVNLPADAGARCAENFSLRSQNLDFAAFAAALQRRPLDADARNLSTLVRGIDVPVYLSGGWQDEQTGSQFGLLLDDFGADTGGDLVTKFRLYNGRHPDGYTPVNLSRWYEHLSFYVKGETPELPATIRSLAGAVFVDFMGVEGLSFEPDRFADEGTYPTFESALAAYEASPDVDLLWDFGAGMEGEPGAPEYRSSVELESWPPPSDAWRLFLGPDGTLGDEPPPVEDVLRYRFDPDAGSKAYADESGADFIKPQLDLDWAPMGQGDGLSFETPVLEETAVIAGNGHLDLWFRSEGYDAGIEMILTEVYPDGGEVLVQHGLLRAAYGDLKPITDPLLREPLYYEENYEPLAPGEVRHLQIPIFPVAHPFRAGSKLRVTINTPGRDAPIWSYEYPDDPDWAGLGDGDPKPLTTYGGSFQEVAIGGSTPSAIVLPLVSDPAITSTVVQSPPPCNSLRGQPCRDYVPVTNEQGCASTRFSDLAFDNPFCLAISTLVADGIIEGDQGGTMRPTAPVSRQAAAAFMYRTAGSPEGEDPTCDAAPFEDVGEDHPFCGEIAWAAEAGITTGYADGTFAPTEPVSRQAMVAFLSRLAGADPAACADAPFTDVSAGHTFCAEIAWAVDAGITTGYEDGTFRPTAPVSRQAMAAFLHRLDLG